MVGLPLSISIDHFALTKVQDFTDHQRHVFCVFSGPGVDRLRKWLNEAPPDDEATMYDDRDNPDAALDGHVAGMMHAAAINDDDDEMEEIEAADGSQYGEVEG